MWSGSKAIEYLDISLPRPPAISNERFENTETLRSGKSISRVQLMCACIPSHGI